MNKLIKLQDKAIVLLESGDTLTISLDKNSYEDIVNNLQDDKYLYACVASSYSEQYKKVKENMQVIEDIKDVPFLDYSEDKITWPSVSTLSMPVELIQGVVKAHKENNERALKSYKNFWTLLSLNPDEDVRKNLLWFLNLHGLVLSSSGFFIAYRNVEKTDEVDEEGNPIYTDVHSHTTKISIGKMVTLDRNLCDSDSNHECSRGLHVASVKWLRNNYFGDTGMVVLVNPSDTVAVPKNSDYGKLRTCAYLPIDYCHYDELNHVIPYDVEMGFDCKYATQAIYEGIMGTESDTTYKIDINFPTIEDKTRVSNNLLEIALDCITNKEFIVVNDTKRE